MKRAITALVLLFSMGAYAHVPTKSEKEKAEAQFAYIEFELYDEKVCLKTSKNFKQAYCDKVKKRYKELLKRQAGGDPFKD